MAAGGWEVWEDDALTAARGLENGTARLGKGLQRDPPLFRLVYLDPPFFTNRRQEGRGGAAGVGYADRWTGGLSEYLGFLHARLEAIRPLIAEDGALLLHLDWRAVHHARILCDDVFGANRLQNEIIWSYRSGGGTKRRYGRKHDTILWYANGPEPYFDADAARVPYDAVIAPARAHLFHPGGKVSGDVLDIPRPPNHSREWTGWPTQKPLALLRFLIRVHSAPGDLVGDFFCGSGTTLAAARELGRLAFGCDLSTEAVEIARKRLAAFDAEEDAGEPEAPRKEARGGQDLFPHPPDGV